MDWTRTRAYALGLNGLYVNTQGREGKGIVRAGGARGAGRARSRRSCWPSSIRRPGSRPSRKAFLREQVYHRHAHLDLSPDIVVGYARGTRGWRATRRSAVVPPEVFSDNREHWSGDHCMDPDHVPGVLFTSRPLKVPAPGLQQLAASILAEFGVTDFPVAEDEV